MGDNPTKLYSEGTPSDLVVVNFDVNSKSPTPFETWAYVDLGGPCVAIVKAYVTAVNPDTETLGVDDGDVTIDILSIRTDYDPAFPTRNATTAVGNWLKDVQPAAGDPLPFFSHLTWGVCARYLQFHAAIVAEVAGDPYAGVHHPTGTYRIEITRTPAVA